MTSAENSNFENFLGEDTPRHPTPPSNKARAFGTRDNAPVTKSLATALGNAKKILCHFEIPFKSRERKGDLIDKLSSFIQEYTCFSPSTQ